jgi:2-keto-4-pentenoate hydratase/2-oxohepta-3-ene-1,7-dioic acid hydratase in catechol pathway
VKELNNQRPKQPFFFLKPPSSILLPNEGPLLRPKGVNMHYEIELGLVMGKTLRDFDEKDEQGAIDAIESTTFSPHPDRLTAIEVRTC